MSALPDKFCYVIFWWDANGDPDEVYLDSVWTTNEAAIERMKVIKADLIAEGDKVDWNFTEAFPFADDTDIRWMLNDTEWDPNRGIYCKRIFLDPAFMLEPKEPRE